MDLRGCSGIVGWGCDQTSCELLSAELSVDPSAQSPLGPLPAAVDCVWTAADRVGEQGSALTPHEAINTVDVVSYPTQASRITRGFVCKELPEKLRHNQRCTFPALNTAFKVCPFALSSTLLKFLSFLTRSQAFWCNRFNSYTYTLVLNLAIFGCGAFKSRTDRGCKWNHAPHQWSEMCWESLKWTQVSSWSHASFNLQAVYTNGEYLRLN